MRRPGRLFWWWVQIIWYRHKGRAAYHKMVAIKDSVDCGIAMLETISPRYARARHQLDYSIKKLEAIQKEHTVPSVV